MSCRLCLNSAEILIPVFDASGTDAMRMAATVAKFTGIQLSASDTHHSSKICVSCWASVDNFQKFCLLVAQRQAELSDLELTEEREETPQVFEVIETDDTHFEQEMEVDFAMMSAKNARNEDETLPEDIKDMLYCEAEPAQIIKIEDEETTEATTATKKRKVKRKVRRPPKETVTNLSKDSKDFVLNEASNHADAAEMCSNVEEESDDETLEPKNSKKRSPSKRATNARKLLRPSKRDANACLEDDRLINGHMQLECDVCHVLANNFQDLIQHFKVAHNATGYAVCCRKRLYKRGLLIDHINVHKNPEYFKCEHCGHVFADRVCLRNHILLKHRSAVELSFQCDHCGKKFAKAYLLQRHAAMHISGERRTHHCKSCDKSSLNRKRTTDHGVTDFGELMDAIKAIKVYKQGIRNTALMYNIPRSSLSRYIKKFDKEIPDISAIDNGALMSVVRRIGSFATPKKVFQLEEEEALLDYITKCCRHYCGLSITEMKQFAYQFARKINVQCPPSWHEHQMAGRGWYYYFMIRHQEVILRTPEQTSLHAAKGLSRLSAEEFFRNFHQVRAETPFEATAIWSMDEFGFSTVPCTIGEVLAIRDVKRVGQPPAEMERGDAMASNSVAVTLALTVSAAGDSMPPFCLFPRQTIDAVFMENASNPDAIAVANDSGWMKQHEFVKYMRHFIACSRASLSSPALLILDNHASYLSVAALDVASENGVTLLYIPPHCSHRMQPLHVSVFGPLQSNYKSQCTEWRRRRQNNVDQVLEMRDMAAFVKSSLDLALTPENIRAGFEASGICPYNADIFTDADFMPTTELGGEQNPSPEEQQKYEEQQRNFFASFQLRDAAEEPPTLKEPPPSTTTSQLKRAAEPHEKNEMHKRLPAKKQYVTLRKESSTTLALQLEDEFCVICLQKMPRKPSATNVIQCHKCKRAAHFKCAAIRGGCFTCKYCVFVCKKELVEADE